MNPVQTQKPSSDQSPSFDDVSKLFSLPLYEASDILGVSSSVLKKICNENGLERWPHRKYLAGKSIEEIKMEAAREKSKAQTDKQRNTEITAGAMSTSNSPPMTKKTTWSGSEVSKSHTTTPQQAGSKDVHTWRHQHLHSPGIAIETPKSLDEFKYGFPSDGLSVYTKQWWGNGSPESDGESPRDGKNHSEGQVEEDTPSKHVDDAGNEAKECGNHTVGEVSLSVLRKRAAEEGREALKLGIWKDYGIERLGKKDQILLRRLFQQL